MKLFKLEISPINATHSTVTLVLSDGNLDDPKSELLHIRMGIEHPANPLVSEVYRAALHNVRAAISVQFEEINKLPPPLDRV
jgi:hypothetical protein